MYSASRIHRLEDDILGKVEMGRWNTGKEGGRQKEQTKDRKGKVRTCLLSLIAQTFPRCMWDHSAIKRCSFLRQNEAHAR